jgi:hypothetical protein
MGGGILGMVSGEYIVSKIVWEKPNKGIDMCVE